jgi:hypothetical protein
MMSKPIIPPRGFFVPTTVLFHSTIQGAERDTLIQLMALSWGSKAHVTPRLTIEGLAAITGKAPSTLYRHMALLRDVHAALRLHRAEDGAMLVVLSEWLFAEAVHPPILNSQNRESLFKEEEESVNFSEDLSGENPPPLDHDHTQREGAPARGSGDDVGDTERPVLEESLQQELLDAGVFPCLLAEVAESGMDEAQLRALLAWARADRPESPAGLFIARMRMGLTAPEIYQQPPCPHCGVYGGHAQNCHRRYADGPLAEFYR